MTILEAGGREWVVLVFPLTEIFCNPVYTMDCLQGQEIIFVM